MNNYNLKKLYSEDSNHFLQIQKVVNKIINEKESLNKFCHLKSIEERYDFTISKCKELFIKPKYSQDEYSKFQLFTDIFHEIGKNLELSQEFNELSDLNGIYYFMDKFVKKYNLDNQYKKEEFEKFLYALSYNTKLISNDELEHVAAGKSTSSGDKKDIIDNMLEFDSRSSAIYNLGTKIGKLINMVKLIF